MTRGALVKDLVLIAILGAVLTFLIVLGNALQNRLSAPLERSRLWRRYLS
jgi:hypothetical protein